MTPLGSFLNYNAISNRNQHLLQVNYFHSHFSLSILRNHILPTYAHAKSLIKRLSDFNLMDPSSPCSLDKSLLHHPGAARLGPPRRLPPIGNIAFSDASASSPSSSSSLFSSDC